ncbi:hypothetical protein CAOG_009547 [Capsaspora owczarzaki ATCC 30864]|uniref:Uncharacterized protein n=1 Tax=Capsaspora owczarzaki (strain ATCC 30864) TaxID=595528 RepID=A0A0D2U878_CAPO3|nr:hypothetical protein CAOG_009547 [Capsaspora owczarzaki ATCC 30864]
MSSIAVSNLMPPHSAQCTASTAAVGERGAQASRTEKASFRQPPNSNKTDGVLLLRPIRPPSHCSPPSLQPNPLKRIILCRMQQGRSAGVEQIACCTERQKK